VTRMLDRRNTRVSHFASGQDSGSTLGAHARHVRRHAGLTHGYVAPVTLGEFIHRLQRYAMGPERGVTSVNRPMGAGR
jgi:hypothetical protein